MDRAQFDSVVLPRLLSQLEVEDAILEYGFSPAELDTVLWGCLLPSAYTAAGRLPDLRELFSLVEMNIDDRPFEGDFWSALPGSNPDLTPWLRGGFRGHRFYLLFRCDEERFRPDATFSVDVVSHDDLRALRSEGVDLIEHTYSWCCACVALAKAFFAREVELEVLDRIPDKRLVIWQAE